MNPLDVGKRDQMRAEAAYRQGIAVEAHRGIEAVAPGAEQWNAAQSDEAGDRGEGHVIGVQGDRSRRGLPSTRRTSSSAWLKNEIIAREIAAYKQENRRR